MSLPTLQGIKREIHDITDFLVAKGLADDQNYPNIRSGDGHNYCVEYPNIMAGAAVLRDRPYADMYSEQVAARSFNVKMLDGAIIQITYTFANRVLRKGRLCFLPSPDLSEYQNDPQLYLEDVIFTEVVDRRVVTVPLRFDFDVDKEIVEDVHHPSSHLTLGQYKNCRIAATAAITPGVFIDFILRSFYNTASRQHSSGLPRYSHRFNRLITENEAKVMHVAVP